MLEDLLDCFGMKRGTNARKIHCGYVSIERLCNGELDEADRALTLCGRLEELVDYIGYEVLYPEYCKRHAKKLINDIRLMYM